MSGVQAFRDEHAALIPHVGHLRALAVRLPDEDPVERAAAVRDVLGFLNGTLIPHAEAEERVLYPAIAEILGSPQATATMVSDHRAIVARINDLAATGPDAVERLQELLYGLYALLIVHFHKEEDDYLPLLESAAPERVAEIVERMEAHAHHHPH